MAYRFVSSEDAPTAQVAERFVEQDSGGAVFAVAGKTVEVWGGWRVEVFSSDGLNELPDLVQVESFAAPDPSLQERKCFESVQEQIQGWAPYLNPAKPAGR